MRYFFLGIKEKYSTFDSQESQDEDENTIDQVNVKGNSTVKYYSVMKPINDEELNKSIKKQYLFENLETFDEVSKG